MPAVFKVIPLKIAMPLSADTESVPPRIAPPGPVNTPRVIVELSVVMTLPLESSTATVMAGEIALPISASVGCWMKAN